MRIIHMYVGTYHAWAEQAECMPIAALEKKTPTKKKIECETPPPRPEVGGGTTRDGTVQSRARIICVPERFDRVLFFLIFFLLFL